MNLIRLGAYQNGEDHQAGHADLKGAFKGLGIPRALAVQEVPAAYKRSLLSNPLRFYAQKCTTCALPLQHLVNSEPLPELLAVDLRSQSRESISASGSSILKIPNIVAAQS